MSTRRARVQLSTRFLRVHDSTGSVLNPSRMVCMRSRQRDGRRASDPTIASRYLWSFACSEQEIDRRELIKEELNARIRTSRNHYCDCATCLGRPQGVNDYGLRCFQALVASMMVLPKRHWTASRGSQPWSPSTPQISASTCGRHHLHSRMYVNLVVPMLRCGLNTADQFVKIKRFSQYVPSTHVQSLSPKVPVCKPGRDD